ncbi:uncharacterized protein [Chironomus tepperi]|uniref:uncharacterized protein n=1 Tax=Chironomus tepperi TaxID=113505 RepID=UPI00391F2AD3
MLYHRKMINEFLCSKFVAEKILENIKPKTMFKRRMGLMDSPDELEKNNSLVDDGVVRERMLFDEGSYQYKNWLAKTTTLNDIYRTMGIRYQYGPPPSAPQQETYSHSNYYPAPTYMGGHEMKTVNLKDIFEIALTTLAFLSFGMFIVQVIICITMAKNNDMMLPMEVTADGGEAEAAELEVRVKRSVDHYDPNIQQVNEISRRALRSFEAFLVAKHDNGQCLKKYICENNKFSRKTVDLQKYLIPILGLGLSWVSNKITNQPITANLDNLQASIIGLVRK